MRSARSKCGAMWASRPTGMPLRRGRRPRRPAQNHLRFAPVFSEYDRTLYGAMPTSRRTAQAEICSIPRRTRAGFPLCFVGADALGGPHSTHPIQTPHRGESVPHPITCHPERSEAESKDLGTAAKKNSMRLSKLPVPSGGILSERSERMQRIAKGGRFRFLPPPLETPH